MEGWNSYYEEAAAYYKTVVGARKKDRPFGNLVYYNMIGLSLEGFLTAVIAKDDDLPEHSSISSMLRMIEKKYEVPEAFTDESRFFNRFMNFCSLEMLEMLEPTDEEIDRMVKFVADLKDWIDRTIDVLEESC
ncbi:hypothetical protein [uncultured Sunxiuqinia sp.]|uniref:hypothetical protein n=1 Tax=uncultured Sunxiuqinia sp. TaxID=1573825 RepID=UPI002AA93447|nr:hypothetical protein [uncultured Sunxiuqinia sp.]